MSVRLTLQRRAEFIGHRLSPYVDDVDALANHSDALLDQVDTLISQIRTEYPRCLHVYIVRHALGIATPKVAFEALAAVVGPEHPLSFATDEFLVHEDTLWFVKDNCSLDGDRLSAERLYGLLLLVFEKFSQPGGSSGPALTGNRTN
jgi:hypothetical protein